MINVQRRVTAAGVPAPSTLRAWAMAALEGATPGEITIQLPCALPRVQLAPVVGGVEIAIDWLDPLMTEAQPQTVRLRPIIIHPLRNVLI